MCFILRQVDLGDDPCLTEQKLKILKEQDEAVAAYKVSQGIGLIYIEHLPLNTHILFICISAKIQW